MPVFQCDGCQEPEPCRLFIQEGHVACPDKCPWGGDCVPVWRELRVSE